jgi:hypothetical protein
MIRTNRVAAIAAALAVASAAHGNLLVNGSFESDDASLNPFYIRYTGANHPTGWTQFADGVDLLHDTYTQGPSVLVQPHSGTQFMDVNAAGQYGGIRQDISVTPGTAYALSFYTAAWATNSAGSLQYALVDATDNSLINFGIISVSPSTPGWRLATLTGTATSPLLRVEISATGGVSQAAPALDSVSLIALPEPSTALFTAAATTLASLTRRRRTR